MASNSKKRRRVLRVSCILAALIIAGSSFAWFTSKDEVTNRLSANADYGVSIVESFAPPAKWLPGQEVNKDVYAVNTGNIDAFVREILTTKMTITREREFDPTAVLSAGATATTEITDKDAALVAAQTELVKLTPAERYVIEAGSYLALMPELGAGETSNNTVGMQVVSFSNNPQPTGLDDYVAETKYTDFTPDKNGLYVFRRTVDVGADKGAVTYADEDFTYAAYYYINGEYYKVKLNSVTHDNVIDRADDGKSTDGILTAADGVLFYDETTVETPELSYDAGAHELIATVKGKYDPTTDDYYTTDTGTTTPAAGLNALGTAYDDALDAYDDALADYLRAYQADSNASDAEKQALAELTQAQIAFENAKNKLEKEEAHLAALGTELSGKEAALGTTTTADTALYNQEQARSALYGTGTESSPAAGSLGQLLSAAETAMNDSLENDAAFRAEVLNVLNLSSSDKTTAELVLSMDDTKFGTLMTTCAQHNQFENTSKYYQALRNYNAKLAEYNKYTKEVNDLRDEIGSLKNSVKTSLTTLYGAPTANTWEATGTAAAIPVRAAVASPADDSYLKIYNDAKDALGEIDDPVTATTAYGRYNKAKKEHSTTEDGGTGKTLKEKEVAVVAAKSALDTARMKYEQAVEKKDQAGDLIIHIGLKNVQTADGTGNVSGNDVTTGAEADKWQLLPTALEDKFKNADGTAYATGATPDGKMDTATFYYTSLLGAGETSSQLVDYVKLDDSVNQYMYKSFDFDIDVSLDSAQVVYDTDGSTVKAEAATATFGKTPTIYNPQDYGTNATLKW